MIVYESRIQTVLTKYEWGKLYKNINYMKVFCGIREHNVPVFSSERSLFVCGLCVHMCAHGARLTHRSVIFHSWKICPCKHLLVNAKHHRKETAVSFLLLKGPIIYYRRVQKDAHDMTSDIMTHYIIKLPN